MNLQSMTGFGRAEAECKSGNYRIEIKSVNNRFLDVQFRIPRVCNPFEQKIKSLLSQKLVRGSVNVSISREAPESELSITYKPEIAEKYVAVLKSINSDYSLNGEISISDLQPYFKDIITQEVVNIDEDELWEDIEHVLTVAVDNIVTVRETEGEYIRKGLLEILDEIKEGLVKVKEIAPARLVRAKERLKKAVADLKGEGVDEARLAFETSIMADKLDIAEEILRLSAHIEAMEKILNSNGEVGKKMNFLLQEMNREINTIGSKANDKELSAIVVNLKEAAERIREQALNLV